MSVLFDVGMDASPILHQLTLLRQRGSNLRETMSVIAEDLVAAVSDEFESEGRGKWAPLAESTLAKRRKRGRGAKILQDTGRWAGSHHPVYGDDFAEAATDVSYAVFHVSDAPRTLIPLRNPYDLPEEVYRRAEQTILAAVVGR